MTTPVVRETEHRDTADRGRVWLLRASMETAADRSTAGGAAAHAGQQQRVGLWRDGVIRADGTDTRREQ
jgi:hypothetical protein